MGTSCLETDLGERTLPYSKSIQVNCPSLQMLFHKVPSSNPQAKRKHPLTPCLLCTCARVKNWTGMAQRRQSLWPQALVPTLRWELSQSTRGAHPSVGRADLRAEWPSETRDFLVRGEKRHTHRGLEQAEERQLLYVLESYQLVVNCSHF